MDVISLVEAVIAWLVLMVIGTNLVGLVVRGLVGEGIPSSTNYKEPILRKEAERLERTNLWITLFFAAVTVAYIYILLRVWNVGVAAAALMLMVARTPDLLYEIKTGKKVGRKNMPYGIIGILLSLLIFGALPLLWFSLR